MHSPLFHQNAPLSMRNLIFPLGYVRSRETPSHLLAFPHHFNVLVNCRPGTAHQPGAVGKGDLIIFI